MTRQRASTAADTAPRLPAPVLILVSAGLLVVAFPSFNQPWAAWIALVPWLHLLRQGSAREAFRASWLIGGLFFAGSMWWMVQLTAFGGTMAILGWLLLAAYLGLYSGLFGVLAHRARRHPAPLSRLLLLPAAWVAAEFLRAHLLTGQGWNLLAYSQTPWPAAIQLADITGAWGISFLIVLVNAAIEGLLSARTTTTERLQAVLLAALLVGAALGYGRWRMPRIAQGPPLRFGVVQGNIPQTQKWDEQYAESILERHETLTRQLAQEAPDVIVWPEASVPGVIGVDDEVTQRVQHLAKEIGRPLLVGAPMVQVGGGDNWRMTNSAALLDGQGSIIHRYDKIHLVVFGEYVPFERWLPWLRHVLPPIGDFVPGASFEVFHIASGDWELPPFSVLICFEDVFPELARRFVREGAQALVTITNDAWFGPTAAAYQHAQASTFRAVELRRPVVRAANTGWSGCIDAAGRWQERVKDDAGHELFVPGTVTCEVASSAERTLCLRFGDWLAWLCLAGCAAALAIEWRGPRRSI